MSTTSQTDLHWHSAFLFSELQTRAEKAEADCERFRLHTLKQDAECAYIRADNLAAHRMACEAGIERDQLRAEMAAMNSEFNKMLLSASERGDRNVQLKRRAEKAEAAIIEKNAPEIAKINAEFASREAEVERLTELLRIESAASAHALLWAEKAEDDTLRLDWLLNHQVSTQHYGCNSYSRMHASRASIDAAMKEDSK